MSGPQNLKDRIWVGDRILEVPALAPGERLVPVAELSELLVISQAAQQAAAEAVERAALAEILGKRRSGPFLSATRMDSRLARMIDKKRRAHAVRD